MISLLWVLFCRYDEVCDLKFPDGSNVFNVRKIDLFCEECRKASNGTVKACRHVLKRLPPWKEQDKHEIVAMIYDCLGSAEDMDRESRGIQADDGSLCFSDEMIDAFKKRPPFPIQNRRVQEVLITIDPNGGGFSSDTAMIAAYYLEDSLIICGIESFSTHRETLADMMKSHLLALRRIPHLKDATFRVIPENNLDWAAYILIEEAKKHTRVIIGIDKEQDGNRTERGSKLTYTEKLLHYLGPPNKIFFDAHCVCSYGPPADPKARLQEMKQRLYKQLKEWKYVRYCSTKKAGPRPYLTCSGKLNGAGEVIPDKKDDLMIALSMSAYLQWKKMVGPHAAKLMLEGKREALHYNLS